MLSWDDFNSDAPIKTFKPQSVPAPVRQEALKQTQAATPVRQPAPTPEQTAAIKQAIIKEKGQPVVAASRQCQPLFKVPLLQLPQKPPHQHLPL